MGDKTGIEYLDATWNPVKGCSHISPGCENCWAERQAARFSKKGEFFHGLTDRGVWTGEPRFYEDALYKPIHWRRPRRIGVCFMGDLFHESVPFEWIAKVFAVMAYANQHTFLVLTKHPERMRVFLEWAGRRVCPSEALYDYIEDDVKIDYEKHIVPWPLPNVWLGVSVENQTVANYRIPVLLECPAALRYISAEPLLGPIDIDRAMYGEGKSRVGGMNAFGFTDGFGYEACLRWVVAGGESGPNARPMHPVWVESIRDQCVGAGIPFYFKRWGAWAPVEAARPGDLIHYTEVDLNPRSMRRVGKSAAGHLIDGVAYQQLPVGGER